MREGQIHRWFPLFLDLAQWRILVVGGGKIAGRRIQTLVEFEPEHIRVVAKEIGSGIWRWKDLPNMEICEREYRMEDLENCQMVIAATDDGALNQKIGEECTARGILVNVASDQKLCGFHFPGVVTNGPITVGINAAGLDHRLARNTREQIQKLLDGGNESYGQ